MSRIVEPKTTAKIFLMYSAKCDESDELRDQLRYALETIEILENEIGAIKDRTLKILSKLAHIDETFESFPPAKESQDHWIADLWLRLPENGNLFGKIEDLWEQNVDNPQKALVELSRLKTWDELRENEWIWCSLLEATMQLHSGQTEEAVALLNMALRRCQDHKFSQLRGIGHYFRARYFIIFDNYRTAYWDLCLAAGTDGYAGRIEDLIKIVEQELSKPQNTGQSLRESIRSNGLPGSKRDPQKGFQEWIGEVEASTSRHIGHEVPYMKEKANRDRAASSVVKITPRPSESQARPGSKNSFDKAIQSFGPLGESLVNSPSKEPSVQSTSPSHRDTVTKADDDHPFQKSVAEHDYYDRLPADVQAGMLSHENKCIESNPILRNHMLDESLIDQNTLDRLPPSLQEHLLNPESEIDSGTTQSPNPASSSTLVDERNNTRNEKRSRSSRTKESPIRKLC